VDCESLDIIWIYLRSLGNLIIYFSHLSTKIKRILRNEKITIKKIQKVVYPVKDYITQLSLSVMLR
jgi:hypothetical protein